MAAVIKIQQTGSPIRRHYKQRLTLIGLGLNRIGRVAEVPDTPQTRGMIARVRHLVRLLEDTKLLRIDFVRDFADILRQRLMAAGFGPVPGETDKDSITRYLNVLSRSVEPRVRQTKMAAGLTCPPAEAAGLQMLLQKSETGGDLRPHQSMNIDKANYDDGMFNDWGVQHFHLGTVPYPKAPQFMDRTGPLLYAFVTPDTLYGIAVLEHQEWSNQMLLNVMHKNFPELTAASTLKSDTRKPSRLSVNYSDEDVAKLRAAGINVLTQRPDGTITVGPGGGVTLNRQRGKKSAKVAHAVINVIKTIRQVEGATKEKIDEANIAATVQELDVRLTETADKLVATDAAAGLRIDIDTRIVKPI